MSAEEKHLRQVRAIRLTRIKWSLFWIVLVTLVLVLLWSSTIEGDPNNPLVSRSGVHYHAKLTVETNGVEQEIPSGIGLIAGMEHPQQMHTHENDQIVHVEIPGAVREDETRLINFFRVWGKELTATTLLGIEATSTQRILMTVNGVDEPRLGDYPIKDGDEIKLVLK